MTEPRMLAVIDIDGVLADVRNRLHHVTERPKDWAAFFAGAPDEASVNRRIRWGSRWRS